MHTLSTSEMEPNVSMESQKDDCEREFADLVIREREFKEMKQRKEDIEIEFLEFLHILIEEIEDDGKIKEEYDGEREFVELLMLEGETKKKQLNWEIEMELQQFLLILIDDEIEDVEGNTEDQIAGDNIDLESPESSTEVKEVIVVGSSGSHRRSGYVRALNEMIAHQMDEVGLSAVSKAFLERAKLDCDESVTLLAMWLKLCRVMVPGCREDTEFLYIAGYVGYYVSEQESPAGPINHDNDDLHKRVAWDLISEYISHLGFSPNNILAALAGSKKVYLLPLFESACRFIVGDSAVISVDDIMQRIGLYLLPDF